MAGVAAAAATATVAAGAWAWCARRLRDVASSRLARATTIRRCLDAVRLQQQCDECVCPEGGDIKGSDGGECSCWRCAKDPKGERQQHGGGGAEAWAALDAHVLLWAAEFPFLGSLGFYHALLRGLASTPGDLPGLSVYFGGLLDGAAGVGVEEDAGALSDTLLVTALAAPMQHHTAIGASSDRQALVVAALVVEPCRLVEKFGFRPLSEDERQATFTVWRAVAQRLGVRRVPSTYAAAEAMVDAQRQRQCGEDADVRHDPPPATTHARRAALAAVDSFLRTALPPVLSRAVFWELQVVGRGGTPLLLPLARALVHATVDPGVRRALGIPDPGPLARWAAHAVLAAHAIVVRNWLAPADLERIGGAAGRPPSLAPAARIAVSALATPHALQQQQQRQQPKLQKPQQQEKQRAQDQRRHSRSRSRRRSYSDLPPPQPPYVAGAMRTPRPVPAVLRCEPSRTPVPLLPTQQVMAEAEMVATATTKRRRSLYVLPPDAAPLSSKLRGGSGGLKLRADLAATATANAAAGATAINDPEPRRRDTSGEPKARQSQALESRAVAETNTEAILLRRGEVLVTGAVAGRRLSSGDGVCAEPVLIVASSTEA
ncbi:hypothetical protein HK405_011686 [Cladochytrium tenue]|nr:hypothetical protein HK405_011686 [Cladochytrium tenue]